MADGFGIGIDFKFAKANFFDSEKIIKHISAGERKVLSKFGAFVRRRARSSLRRRKAIAAPGSPPSVHSNDPYASLKNILFAYDAANKSVVIGVVQLNGSQVPNVQEHGGATKITRHPKRAHPQTVTVNVRPHPFMNPAGEFERTHSLPALFKNAF